MLQRRLIVACLLAVLSQPIVPAGAQHAADATLLVEWGALGLVPGQVLRATLTNLRLGRPARVSAAVIDQDGQVLARTAGVDVHPGQFRTLDFSRAALPAAGDPASGRLQVRTTLRVVVPGVTSTVLLQQLASQLTASLVVFNAASGQDESGMIGDIRTVISGEAAQ